MAGGFSIGFLLTLVVYLFLTSGAPRFKAEPSFHQSAHQLEQYARRCLLLAVTPFCAS